MKRFWIRRGLGFLGFGIVIAGLLGLVVMSLWNAILPVVLGVTTITFWQALGLLILSRILFGGFGRPGRGGPRSGHWKQKMAERFEKMTPEQREKMRQHWQSRCGNRNWGGGPPWQQRSDETAEKATS